MRSPTLLFFLALFFVGVESLQFLYLSAGGIDDYEYGRELCLTVSVTIWSVALTTSGLGFFYAMRNLIVGKRGLVTMAGVAFNLCLSGLLILIIFFY